jgi:hypothetical protein
MPSDQDDSRAMWQDAGTLDWVDSADISVQPGRQQVQEEVTSTDDLLTPDTESDLLQWTRQPLVSKETMGTLARQLSPVLVPLPFAVVVFFLSRLLSTPGPAFLPALATGILLLALTILQGSLLYFAGANDTLWLLYIAGGYALFLLGGVFAAFGVVASLVTLGLLLVLGGFLTRRGIYPTKEGYVDLVELFGKYTHTFYPGLNLLLPWEKVSQRLNTQETIWLTPLQHVPTSRDQDVQLTATVSYQLIAEDAHLAALMVNNWEGSLQALFIGTLQSVINELSPADFVAWTQSVYTRSASEALAFNPAAATRWDQINNALNRRLQDQVAAWGVQINWVRIQDLTILPHTVGLHTHHNEMTLIVKPEKKPEPEPVPVSKGAAKPEEPKKPAPAPEPAPKEAPAAAKVALPANKVASVETLIEAYNAVRLNNITDPATMIEIAQRFDDLSKDPVLNQTITFDAGRAASTLRERAQKLQELSSQRSGPSAGLPSQE